MRTTLDIDDDVLAAAKDLAKSEGRTVGQIISELARRALTTPSDAATGVAEAPQAAYETSLWVTLPDRQGLIVTQADIRRVEEELDREDATPFDHDTGEPRVFEKRRTRRKS